MIAFHIGGDKSMKDEFGNLAPQQKLGRYLSLAYVSKFPTLRQPG
jgi:hypothetical protein